MVVTRKYMPFFGLTITTPVPKVSNSLHLPEAFTKAVEQIPKEMQADRYQNMRIYLDTKSLSEGEKYGLIHNWERLYDSCEIYNMENRNDGVRLNDTVFNYMLVGYYDSYNKTTKKRLYHLSQDDPFVKNKILERTIGVAWAGDYLDPDPVTNEMLEKLDIGWVMVNPQFRQQISRGN